MRERMEKILTREESEALFRATQQGQSQAKKISQISMFGQQA